MTNSTETTRTLRRATTLFGAGLLLVATLVGCSAGSTGSAPEATTEMTKEKAAALATDFDARVKKSQDAFKDCVVDHGVDIESAATDVSAQTDEVMELCTKEYGDGPVPSAEEQAGIRYLNQLDLDCLREKGHEVGDLTADGSLPATDDRDDAYFADLDVCRDGRG